LKHQQVEHIESEERAKARKTERDSNKKTGKTDKPERKTKNERKKERKKEAVYVVIPSSNLSLLSSVVPTCRRSSTRKKERAHNSSKSGFVCTSTHFPVSSSSSSLSLSVRSISSPFFENTIIAKKKYKKPQRNPSSWTERKLPGLPFPPQKQTNTPPKFASLCVSSRRRTHTKEREKKRDPQQGGKKRKKSPDDEQTLLFFFFFFFTLTLLSHKTDGHKGVVAR
jgi:hypothetical protein